MSSRLPVAAIALVCVLANVSDAQMSGSLDAVRKATADAYARVEATRARMSEDSARRFRLPVARRYGGMELRADTTQLPASFMKTLDEAFGLALKQVVLTLGPRAHSILVGSPGTELEFAL